MTRDAGVALVARQLPGSQALRINDARTDIQTYRNARPRQGLSIVTRQLRRLLFFRAETIAESSS